MTPYYIAYATLVACCLIGGVTGLVRIALIVASVPMLIMIAGRGLVGVDSAFYVQQFDVIRYGGLLAGGFEPGFGLLVYVMTAVVPDSFAVLVFLGLATTIILFVAAFLLDRSLIIFLALIMPYFLFDMTMNGLRYGMAFSLVGLGFALRARNKKSAFVVCTALAASIQVSSIALVVGAWALLEAKVRTFIAIILISGLVYYFFQDYLGAKLQDNAGLGAQSAFSGVIPLAVGFVFLAAAAANHQLFKIARFPLAALAILELSSFGISRFLYAGLRLQNLVIFMAYIVVAVICQRANIKFSDHKPSVIILLVVSLLSAGLRLKNFSDEEGLGQSPFAPFYFAAELAG